MSRRYKYGPDAGPITITSTAGDGSTPTTSGKTDLDPSFVSFVSAAPDAVTLAVAPYDAATVNPPSEVFALLFPDGVQPPADPAAAIADQSIPHASTTAPIPPEGVAAYLVPHPVVSQGSYFGKVVLAYDGPES